MSSSAQKNTTPEHNDAPSSSSKDDGAYVSITCHAEGDAATDFLSEQLFDGDGCFISPSVSSSNNLGKFKLVLEHNTEKKSRKSVEETSPPFHLLVFIFPPSPLGKVEVKSSWDSMSIDDKWQAFQNAQKAKQMQVAKGM